MDSLIKKYFELSEALLESKKENNRLKLEIIHKEEDRVELHTSVRGLMGDTEQLLNEHRELKNDYNVLKCKYDKLLDDHIELRSNYNQMLDDWQ